MMRSLSLKQYISAAVGLLLLLAWLVWAGTPTLLANASISADTAATGGTGAWTSLSNMSYREVDKGDIGKGVVRLTAPAGFAFNPAATVVVRITAGDPDAFKNINARAVNAVLASVATNNLTINATQISFSVVERSQGGGNRNTITWQGVQVRPLAGYPRASGNVVISVPNSSLVPTSTNMGTLTVVPGAVTKLLTVLNPQNFVEGTGITGTADNVTAGTAFTIKNLVATDRFFNVVPGFTGAKTITYSGPAATVCGTTASYTTAVSFLNGVSTTSLTTTLIGAGAQTISAGNSAAGVTGPASSNLSVLGGRATRLLITLPGQTYNSCGNFDGTPLDQSPGNAFTIGITARDQYFNVANNPALPYAGNKTLNYSGPSGAGTYASPVNFSAGVGSASVSIATSQSTSLTVSEPVGVINRIIGTQSAVFTVVVNTGGFDVFETATPANSLSGIIKTKIAGVPFTLDILVLTPTNTINQSFNDTARVEVVDASDPGQGCLTRPIVGVATTQAFAASDKGRKTMTTAITVADAYKNLRFRVSWPLTSPTRTRCSSNNFAVRPVSFVDTTVSDADSMRAGSTRQLTATPALNSTITHKAGRPFLISTRAIAQGGATASRYTGSPEASVSACAVADICPGTLGSLSPGIWGGSGTVTTSTASYNDVGAFRMLLEDTSFADVDIGDTPLGERIIKGGAVDVSRFVPDFFEVSDPIIINRVNFELACGAQNFTYMNEAFQVNFTLTARDANGFTTPSYAGPLARLDPTVASFLNFGAVNTAGTVVTPLVASISAITKSNPGRVTTIQPHRLSTGSTVYLSGIGGMTGKNALNVPVNNRSFVVTVIDANQFDLNFDTTPVSLGTFTSGGSASRLSFTSNAGAWSSGALLNTATLALTRLTGADGPYNNAVIGVRPIDTDGVTVDNAALDLNADGDSPATLDRVSLGTTQFRFGRLALRPSYGSQLLNLRIPVELQQYNGNGFVINPDDSCAELLRDHMSLGGYTGGVALANLPQSNLPEVVTFDAGAGTILLQRPNPAPTAKGSALLTIDLGPAGANLPFLLGNWGGVNYTANPSVRVTFGNYRSTPVIYAREIF